MRKRMTGWVLKALTLGVVSVGLCGCHQEKGDEGCEEMVVRYEAEEVLDSLRDDFVMLTDVVPDAVLEIRYYSTYNFVGERIEGYEAPVALLTRQAADSLRAASDELNAMGYRFKIFDAYRPARAVAHFARWGLQTEDTAMKAYFYPEVDKRDVFKKGYVAHRSGHSRGSTVDLSLIEMESGREVDMGWPFDHFGEESHSDFGGDPESGVYMGSERLTEEQFCNRMMLRRVMMKHGFRPYEAEWWHFTLRSEPYPNTYFDFPVQRYRGIGVEGKER